MRLLLVHPGPDFSVADVHDGWKEAFRDLGVEVASFQYNDRVQFYSHCLIDTEQKDPEGRPLVKKAMSNEEAIVVAMQGLSHACYTFWPDVVLFVSAFYVPAATIDLIRSRGHKTVIHFTESPYEEGAQLDRAPYADLSLLNDPVNIERYRKLGVTAEYMPHAYRPSVHYPRPADEPPDPALAADLAFIGTGFKSRVEFFEQMDRDGLDILLGGNWTGLKDDSPLRKFLGHDTEQCVDNAEAARVYRSAKTGINFYRREWEEDGPPPESWAMGPREVEMAACRMPFIRDPRGEGDEILPMLPTFDGPGDASEKIRWLLAHPDVRLKIAGQAREAIADRTFASHAKRLLGWLDGI